MRKWESYGPSNITDKTKYWVDLWEDLVDRVNEQIDGLDLTNPQLALREIVDEINYNHLRNHENKRYFKRLLKRIKDRDPVLKEKAEKAGIDFVFLLKEFDGGSNPYLLELCKRTLDILADGRYFERACALLKSIVLPATWQKGEEGTLLTLSQSLIAELMLRGYSLETIRNQPGNLFASYFERNGRLVTDYPLSFSWREFVREGSLDLAAYNSAVRVEVDSLSLEQRIDRLRYYMIAPPIDGYVIFRIDGIKGSAGLDVGPVSFYSPNSKRYLTDPALPSLEAETFGAPGPVYFINAAVRTRFLDKTAVLADAIETLETALDLLSAYLPTNMKLSIRRGSYLITDLEGRNVGYELSISERDEAYSYSKSFDLDRFPIATLGGGELSPLLQGIGGFLFQAPESQTDTEQKIAQSMHWYRKGKESNGSADKLLSYWIAIENLLDFGVATANLLLPKNEEETEFAIARLLLPRLHASKYIY
ncbi:MAG TPA: hypothetical protein VJX67_05405, partial [Blastocatellia bacterium]|nr:hypothetical protein [Blastocatellia bacterium]